MIRKQAVYGRGDGLTPDVAVELTQATERFESNLQMELGDRCVLLDSVIGILSLDCRRGTRLTILADGPDEQAAAEAVAQVLGNRG